MSFLLLVEQAAPETPSANQVVLYPKSDGLIYEKDDTGTERAIAQGIATQAQQETGTDVTVSVTPGRQQFHQSAAKWWCAADVDGVINGSYNMTSVTDGGAGDITFTFATDMSAANQWAALYSARFSAFTGSYRINAQGVTSIQVLVYNLSGTATDPIQHYGCGFGDQ